VAASEMVIISVNHRTCITETSPPSDKNKGYFMKIIFMKLVYYDHNTSFNLAVTHFGQHSQSFRKHSWKLFVDTSVIALVAFSVTSSVLINHFPFRTLVVMDTGKVATDQENIVDAPKLLPYACQGTFCPSATNVQVHCCAEETSCFIPIFPNISFFLHP
jgi:hypothetical protein